MDKLLNNRYISIQIPRQKNIDNAIIDFKYSKTINDVSFDTKIYNILNKYKKNIDDCYNYWDKMKSYSNLFELINYNSYTKSNGGALTLYEPISRAYYKLWEMFCDFEILDDSKRIYNYCALAEGPGGFVECFTNFRKKQFQGKYDNIYCISLVMNNIHVPDWNKIKKFMKSKQRDKIKILYGKDNTGNLYNLDNIIYLKENIPQKCELVTADGGFDYSIDFNKQEQLSYHLIFCEIVAALSILKKGGTFILKIFEIHTNLTVEFIYLLNNYFETVNIVKPYVSRPANSEKYLICKNFRNISDSNLLQLYDIVNKWDNIKKGFFVNSIFSLRIPKFYKKIISMSNYYFTKKQIKNIINTLFLIKQKITKEKKNILIKKQVIYSLIWCEKYNQSINFKSNFLNFLKNG